VSKKTVLYFDTDNKMREYISMFIEAEWSCKVVTSENIDDLENTYSSEISLVIADAPKDKDGALNTEGLNNLYAFHKEKYSNIPFILFSTMKPSNFEEFKNFTNDHVLNSYQEKPPEDQEFMYTVGKALELATPEHAPDYKAVRSKRFDYYNTVPCDVFIKLGRGKFVKIINKYGLYGKEVLDKYAEKNIDFFYIYSKDYPKLSKVFIDNMFNILNDINTPIGKALNAQLESHEEVFSRFKSFGFDLDDTTTKLVRSTVSSTLHTLKKSVEKGVKLFQILNTVKGKSGYMYEHSVMTSYVSCLIAYKMGWTTSNTLNKLCLAAIFQNVFLDNEEDAKSSNLIGRSEISLPIEKIDKIKSHTTKCSEKISKFDNFPVDVSMIISHHHELPDGSGYPNHLDADHIPPLACVFILAHELSVRVLLLKQSKTDVVIEMQKNFNVGNFKKPFKGLLKVITGD
jgi:response regulator RpfG family c-di-GMP phosphodiesterase